MMDRKHVVCAMILVWTFFLASCVSVRHDPAPPRLEMTKSNMESFIARGEIGGGLSAWTRAKNQGELPADFLEDYARNLGGLIDRQAKLPGADTKDADLPEAVKSIGNAASFNRFSGQASDDAWSSRLTDSRKILIRSLVKRGFAQIALIQSLGQSRLLVDDPVLYAEMLDIARSIPNPWAIRQLLSLRPSSDNQPPASMPIEPSEILKACVTVWVDRGIKMDRGLGTPDVVIGSAFFIERSGYLLTNHHVIESEVDPEYEGYSRLFVRLGKSNSEKIPAKVVGWDPVFDLALLKVEMTAPALVPLTRIDSVRPGMSVMAFGSPGGLENTVTAGITSNLDRRLLLMGDVMQIDASVNPGNSGGPLFTSDGDFVGIVFAGIPQFQGVNFSVPAFWIADLLPSLVQEGKVKHPWLGLRLFEFRGAVRALYVVPGSPAWEMGVSPGDIIEALNGQPVGSIADAYRQINRISNGELVNLSWRTGGNSLLDAAFTEKRMEGMCLLGERPEHPLEKTVKSGLDLHLLPALFGFSAEDISATPLSVDLKILEVVPGSVADETGLSVGDTLQVLDWVYDQNQHAAFLVFNISRKTRGYLMQTLQVGSSIDTEDFL